MKKQLLGLFVLLIAISMSSAQTKEFHKWANQPPMGWNSYDCFGAAVNENEVRGNAKMMHVHLKGAGWEYVVIDYCWFYPYVGALNNPPQTRDFSPSLAMDEYGRLLPAPDRFPSAKNSVGFKEIGDYIHSMGLKFGIHVMRGIPREAVAKKLPVKGTNYTADQITDYSTCSWLNNMYGLDMNKPGAQEYYNSLFELYAQWGVDYVKVDDISWPFRGKEIEGYRKAINNCGREIVLSLSPGGNTPIEEVAVLKNNANLWRISGDFWDDWGALKKQFSRVNKWEKHSGPGHWPDADMIPFGLLNRRGPGDGLERRSNFTDTEKYTLMTLWSICRSPLMYGGDLMMMRPEELKLLTNKEVLAVNQKSENNHQLFHKGDLIAWIADIPNSNDKYLAVFNLGEEKQTVTVRFKELGIVSSAKFRDLWSHKDLGEFKKLFAPEIEAHGAGLYRIVN